MIDIADTFADGCRTVEQGSRLSGAPNAGSRLICQREVVVGPPRALYLGTTSTEITQCAVRALPLAGQLRPEAVRARSTRCGRRRTLVAKRTFLANLWPHSCTGAEFASWAAPAALRTRLVWWLSRVAEQTRWTHVWIIDVNGGAREPREEAAVLCKAPRIRGSAFDHIGNPVSQRRRKHVCDDLAPRVEHWSDA